MNDKIPADIIWNENKGEEMIYDLLMSMKDYNRLNDRNNDLISKFNYVKNDDESAGQYWRLKQTIPESTKDEMGNSLEGDRWAHLL